MADEILQSLSPTLEAMYAEGGRPSIPPERLLTATISPTPTSEGTASAKETKRGLGRREVGASRSSDESGEPEPLGPRGAKGEHDAWAFEETDATGLRATKASELNPRR